MSRLLKCRPAAAILSATLLLTACQSSEEKAAEHLESALELVEAGDVDRAIVEFRNVFRLDADNIDAHLAFAEIMREEGRIAEALRSYRRVAEQRTEDYDLFVAAAEVAYRAGSLDDFKGFADRMEELAPDDPRSRKAAALRDYMDQGEREDAERVTLRRTIIEAETDYLDDAEVLVRLDGALAEQDFVGALTELERAIANAPATEQLHDLRLSILSKLRDADGIGESLAEAVETFPDSEKYRDMQLRWVTSNGGPDAAAELLRARIAEAANMRDRISLVALLSVHEGPAAALETAQRFVEETGGSLPLQSLVATLTADLGRVGDAIALLEEVAASSEPSDDLNDLKVVLAQLHQGTGNEVAARRVVEEVLAADATHAQAVVMRAGWMIEDDEPETAITLLRQAQRDAPGNTKILSTLARAHLRNGSRQLAGETLSLAVEVSGSAPEESLAYARYLLAEDQARSAESVLVSALRVSPNNVALLKLLGDVYLRTSDWSRAEQVEQTLARLETAEAQNVVADLRIRRLRATQREDEALAFLESLASQDSAGAGVDIELVRSRIANGELDTARKYLVDRIEEEPDAQHLRLLLGTTLQAGEDFAAADDVYRELLDRQPDSAVAWRSLYQSKLRQGEIDAAKSVLREAIEVLPDDPGLNFMLASRLERDGDISGAIAIYEELYERFPNNLVIANNLASLRAGVESAPEQIEEIYTLARRLNGSRVPAFQDTYGWILHLRGQTEEAVELLQRAARGLPNDPVVQFRLGEAYRTLGRNEEAMEQYRLAVEVAGPLDQRIEIDRSREYLSAGIADGADEDGTRETQSEPETVVE